MADAWLPEAGRLPARTDGGALGGGAPRAVWFSSESDARTISARSVAADLARADRAPHLVWNPWSGEFVQLLPIVRAARMLDAVGREGRVCAQIMVVGQARDPFTGTPLNGLDPLMAWLDSWGVARRWPAGPPLPTPQSYQARRDRRSWARGGHFGASQVPGADRPDPGGIDIRRVTGPETPVAPIPRPRPSVGQPGGSPPAPASPLHNGILPPSPPVLEVPVPEPANARS
ncbi:hypothetical protein [Actinomadura kijaniata]|uniref:hypothetical protein n=1 Tax=Actinomadura kijaniata TaxID=46161 RepID=UPI00082F346C|nr:hypothetical protein [Actinomadura kijaniata]